MLKCKKCGLMGETLDLNAHLVYNRCGAGHDYVFKEKNIMDYCDFITEKEYIKELKKRNLGKIDIERKRGDPIPVSKAALNEDYEPELVTKDTVSSKKSKVNLEESKVELGEFKEVEK